MVRLQKALYKKRFALVASSYARIWTSRQPDEVLDSGRRLQTIGLQVITDPKDQIQFLENLLELEKRLDYFVDKVIKRQNSGSHSRWLDKLGEFRLEVQIELERVKVGLKKTEKR